MSLIYAQATGVPQSNVSLMCAANENGAGLPYVATGAPNATHVGDMSPGRVYNVDDLQCYDSNGNLIRGPLRIGESFNFYIWETYRSQNSTNATTLIVIKAHGIRVV